MNVRLFAPDREEITDRAAWEAHAPAALAHAEAWLGPDGPVLPPAVAELDARVDAVNARPAHPTTLGDGTVHTHGVFACLKAGADTVLVVTVGDDTPQAREAVAIEAKARGVERSTVVPLWGQTPQSQEGVSGRDGGSAA